MKIASVETTCLNVPTTVPLTGKSKSVAILVVLVHTDDGATGIGYCRAGNSGDSVGALGFAAREIITRDLAPLLRGRSPLEIERAWKDTFWELSGFYHIRTGVIAQAMSALDLALWDLKGKLLGQPIHRLLGGAQQSIEAYTTFGLKEFTREELVHLARTLVREGHDKLKIQAVAGRRGLDVEEDVARVRLVREAVGDGVRIMLDGNSKFNLPNALKLAKRLEPYDVTFFDDPVYVKDLNILTQLRRQTTTPIASRPRGENIWDARDMISAGAVDVMQVNVLDCGGFSEGLKIAHMAEMYNLPLSVGGAYYLANSHLLAGVSNGWMVEYHLILDTAWAKVFTGAPLPKNGRLEMSDKPGLGIGIDDAAIREFALA